MVIHQNGTSIKVTNEENVNQTTNAHISETRQDIKISSPYLESAANFTSDGCGFPRNWGRKTLKIGLIIPSGRYNQLYALAVKNGPRITRPVSLSPNIGDFRHVFCILQAP